MVLIEISRILRNFDLPSRYLDLNFDPSLLRGAIFTKKVLKKSCSKDETTQFLSFFTTGMKKLVIFCDISTREDKDIAS